MAKRLEVFVIQQGEGDKSYFHRAGVAFVNRDGSINVKLDLLPNTQLQIREPREEQQKG
jgi:hypothetical protein